MEEFEALEHLKRKDFVFLESYLKKGGDPNYTVNGWSLLHQCVTDPCLESVNLLLDYKANISYQSNSFLSVIHYAAMIGHCEMTKLLLQRGAKPDDYSNNSRETPLSLALLFAGHECLDTIGYLLDAGAKFSNLSHREISSEMEKFLQHRRNLKRMLIVFIALGKRNRCLRKDITLVIASMIWKTRNDFEK